MSVSAIFIPGTNEETYDHHIRTHTCLPPRPLPGPPAPAADAREWRPWCGAPDAETTLGWHFYCDRDEKNAGEDTQITKTAPPASAMKRILKMRRTLEETRARAILEPSPENVRAYLRLQQEALGRAASFSDAFRAHGLGGPRTRLHAETSGGRARQETLVGCAPGGARRRTRPSRGALRLNLPGIRTVPGLPGVRAPPARLRPAPRDKGARGLDDGRSARRLARGGGG